MSVSCFVPLYTLSRLFCVCLGCYRSCGLWHGHWRQESRADWAWRNSKCCSVVYHSCFVLKGRENSLTLRNSLLVSAVYLLMILTSVYLPHCYTHHLLLFVCVCHCVFLCLPICLSLPLCLSVAVSFSLSVCLSVPVCLSQADYCLSKTFFWVFLDTSAGSAVHPDHSTNWCWFYCCGRPCPSPSLTR